MVNWKPEYKRMCTDSKIHTGWRSAITDVKHWCEQSKWERSNSKWHLKAGIPEAEAVESLYTVYYNYVNSMHAGVS